MTTYQTGSTAPEVNQIQQRLIILGLYDGEVDGLYGNGTESAVRAFQSAHGLAVDGRVGPATWGALFGNAAVQGELDFRCLALTGAFETNTAPPDCFAGLTGDFDKQGMSFGALQWCLGQGSLQPLLQEMRTTHPQRLAGIFGAQYNELTAMLDHPLDQQLAWARSIQTAKGAITEPWCNQFKALGLSPEFQAIETAAAAKIFTKALDLCRKFQVRSERAVALMFDICVQNGSISAAVTAQIQSDAARLPASGDEVPLLRIIANRRAEAANPDWVEDVRKRKLAIAEGGGVVHGASYDLAAQYGIGLAPAAALSS
ncbi:Peptidoglycan-binding domain 1 protein [Candidatus Terasakiella magnetica]|nr:Peptidoglycan-binding domain 1 protein [Candidatus Terasakiella magnetica]